MFFKRLFLTPIITAIFLLCSPTLSFSSIQIATDTEFNAQNLPKLDSLKKGKPLNLNIPKMQRFTTTNGIPVIFTAVHELPIVDISILFDGGSSRDSELKKDGFGIANMTANLITKGTKNLNEDAFSWQAERLGVTLGANVNQDSFAYVFRSLADDNELLPALSLFTDMIANPLFDKDTVKRAKETTLIGLKLSEQSADYLATTAFLNAIYGTHPYAKDTIGTQSSVANISADDLKHYHQRYLVAQNAYISITGDLSEQKARQIAEQLSMALPNGNKATLTPAPKKPKPTHIHVDYDSPQTVIIIGHLGAKDAKTAKEIEQELNFRLGNKVLAGGDFNARLMTAIRKQGGYTYGITGSMITYAQNGVYRIRFSTTTDKAKEAIKKTLKIIKDTLETGISENELRLTTTSLRHAYPMTLSNNLAIHNMATYLNKENLPDSYVSGFLSRLDNVTVANVNHTLKSQIHPDEFMIVTVGKQKPDLSDLF